MSSQNDRQQLNRGRSGATPPLRTPSSPPIGNLGRGSMGGNAGKPEPDIASRGIDPQTGELSYRHILRFWVPLALTWLMMSIEGPILTAIIARLPDQEANLAAYGVAFSIGMLIEAPVIMMLSAATALVRDRNSLLKLRNFAYSLNVIITLLMIIISLPPVFGPIANNVLGLAPHTAELAQIGTALLIPWPAAIGFRRFYQGILIREGLTSSVTWGTMMRLAGMLIGGFLLAFGFDQAGIVVGSAGLSIAVTAEAIAARLMVGKSMKKIRAIEPTGPELSYQKIIRFYIPLALTSIIGLGAPPALVFFLGRSEYATESLAVWPVLTSFVFLFRGVGLAWQEVVIALVGDRLEHYRRIVNFTYGLSATTVLLISLVAFTPIASLWFRYVAGLNPELAEFVRLPLQLMVLLPATSSILSLQRGLLVKLDRTGPITVCTAIEVGLMIALLALMVFGFNAVGVVAGSIAVVVGRLVANGYITIPFLRGVRKFRESQHPPASL